MIDRTVENIIRKINKKNYIHFWNESTKEIKNKAVEFLGLNYLSQTINNFFLSNLNILKETNLLISAISCKMNRNWIENIAAKEDRC